MLSRSKKSQIPQPTQPSSSLKENANEILNEVKLVVDVKWLLDRFSYPDKEARVDEYLKFLALQVAFYRQNGTFPSHWSPSVQVDEIWHMHILKVTMYSRDCMAICGALIPHWPENEQLSEPIKMKRRETVTNYYREQLGMEPPTAFWFVGAGSKRRVAAPVTRTQPQRAAAFYSGPVAPVVAPAVAKTNYILEGLDGSQINFAANPKAAVGLLFGIILQYFKLPEAEVRLMFGPTRLDRHNSFEHYGIQEGGTIFFSKIQSGC